MQLTWQCNIYCTVDTESCWRRDVTECAVQQGKYVRIIKKETKLTYGRHHKIFCKMLFSSLGAIAP